MIMIMMAMRLTRFTSLTVCKLVILAESKRQMSAIKLSNSLLRRNWQNFIVMSICTTFPQETE